MGSELLRTRGYGSFEGRPGARWDKLVRVNSLMLEKETLFEVNGGQT